MASENLLADYVALSQFNYIYPFGSLPSNFFFRKVKQNPIWLENEIRNTKINLNKKPTIYKANTSVQHVGPLPTGNTILIENSFKNLIGPYIDTCSDKKSIQHNYEIASSVKVEDDLKLDGEIEVSFDLLSVPMPASFTKHKVKYNKTGTMITSVCPPCEPDWKPAFDGVIVLCGKDALGVDKCTEYNLSEATKCDPLSKISYEIEGNRLTFKLKKEHRVEVATSEFTASIIEEKIENLLTIDM